METGGVLSMTDAKRRSKIGGRLSGEELQSFGEAVGSKHISQSHLKDPIASCCCRCPLYFKVVNWENLPSGI